MVLQLLQSTLVTPTTTTIIIWKSQEALFIYLFQLDSQDGTWYPKEKIRQAKKKLHGYNPSRVMCIDLKQGHEKTQEYSALRAILLGDKKYNDRAKVEGQQGFHSDGSPSLDTETRRNQSL